MPELGCQAHITERSWLRGDFRPNIERRLTYALKAAGAHDIVIEAPERVYVDGFYDEEGEWQALEEPYWAWEINAIGQTDA